LESRGVKGFDISYNLVAELAWRIAGSALFSYGSGYACPICGFGKREEAPKSALSLALHLAAEHRDVALKILLASCKPGAYKLSELVKSP